MNRRDYRVNRGGQTQTPDDLYTPQNQTAQRGSTAMQASNRPRMMSAPQAEPNVQEPMEPAGGSQLPGQVQQPEASPQGYQSSWDDQIYAIMDQIMNREKFSYDLNADALYQQYANQFQNRGQLAMMDTMGQAAAMTGGYGNSYAQMAGQQAYQGYLQQLNDVIPELYGMARDQYDQEGQNLLNQYGLLAGQEQLDYDRYRDQVADEQWEREYEEDLRRWNFANGITTEEESGGNGSGGNGGGDYWVDPSQVQQDVNDAKAAYGDKNDAVELSDAAQEFMSSLPYLPSGGNPEAWKQYVLDKLNNSALSDAEKEEIAYRLDLWTVAP